MGWLEDDGLEVRETAIERRQGNGQERAHHSPRQADALLPLFSHRPRRVRNRIHRQSSLPIRLRRLSDSRHGQSVLHSSRSYRLKRPDFPWCMDDYSLDSPSQYRTFASSFHSFCVADGRRLQAIAVSTSITYALVQSLKTAWTTEYLIVAADRVEALEIILETSFKTITTFPGNLALPSLIVSLRYSIFCRFIVAILLMSNSKIRLGPIEYDLYQLSLDSHRQLARFDWLDCAADRISSSSPSHQSFLRNFDERYWTGPHRPRARSRRLRSVARLQRSTGRRFVALRSPQSPLHRRLARSILLPRQIRPSRSSGARRGARGEISAEGGKCGGHQVYASWNRCEAREI